MAFALALLPLAGCGSSDNGVASKTATQILAATRAAATSASSVHIITSSKVTHGGSVILNASLSKNQGHAQVSFFGISMEAIRSGDTIYVKGNKTFAARLGAVLGVKISPNTWLKGPSSGALAQTTAFTNITTELPLTLSGTGKVTKGATVKVNGQPAITLKLVRKLYTGVLYVAATGQPYPLKLLKRASQAGPGETGQTTFTNWNVPVTVNPPANAIDITKLQHAENAH